VREFIEGFDGLKSTAKQAKILNAFGMKRAKLSELVRDEDVDDERCEVLLRLMQGETKQVKPADLGFIGKEHLHERCTSLGCESESFHYARMPRRPGVAMEVPWIAEAAFAWGAGLEERRLVVGVNWAPSIINPFRESGLDAKGRKIGALEKVLEEAKVSSDDPVVFALHVASARVHYTDSGKTALVLSG
jgi:DNA topoisomerase VI subunit B